MRSFLKNLIRGFRSTNAARATRQPLPRAFLQVESLENRLVPTTILPDPVNHSILLVECSANRVITFAQQSPDVMSISDNVQGLVAQVGRSAVTTVDIIVEGGDLVAVNDSNGMPFVRGQTINLSGNGNNTLDLFGSRAIDTNETYSVSPTASTAPASTLTEDDLPFNMSSAITNVIDTLQNTGGPLTVSTDGNGVILTGSGSEQTLFNLGAGGGGTFTYANKSQVVVGENAASTQVFLEARLPATGEQSFTLQMNAPNDSASVLATPASFITNVQAAGIDQIVNVESTSGSLNIGGGNTTDVNLAAVNIQALVKINDVANLVVTNTGTATQNVTVTQDAIFGTGLFGNNPNAEVSYQHVNLLAINAGSGADDYTVNALSGPFTAKLEIEDTSSTTSFVDNVFVNSLSALNMGVVNLANPHLGELTVHHDGGKAGISKHSPTSTNGVVNVSFPGELPSEVTFDGFASVKTASF